MSAGLSRSLRWRALIRQSGSIQAVMELNLIFFTASYFASNEVVYGAEIVALKLFLTSCWDER